MIEILKDIIEHNADIIIDAITEFHQYRVCDDIIMEDWCNWLEKEIKSIEETLNKFELEEYELRDNEERLEECNEMHKRAKKYMEGFKNDERY